MSTEDPKQIVSSAYDHVATWYLNWVQTERSPRERYTQYLLTSAPPNPHILELGCGPGIPITRFLLDHGAQVTANDISARQLELAQERCPSATFVTGDMSLLNFPPASFDGIICFYTIFHLPRAEQRDMLAKIHSWLKPGGMFVCNFATVDEEEIHGEMLGHGMFWSSYAVEESVAMVRGVGLEVLREEVVVAGEGRAEEGDADYGVEFLWVAAERKEEEG